MESHSTDGFILFFKRFCLFICERKKARQSERAHEWGGGRGAEGEGEKDSQAGSTASAEPNMEVLNLMTPRS